MKCHTKRLIKATLITPWVAVPVSALYSLWHLVSWLGKPLPDPAITMISPNPFKPWEAILLYSLYGVPTAYVSLLVIGLPCYFFAKKLNALSFLAVIFAAVAACIPAAILYGGSYHFWPMFGLLLTFGVPMAITFAWILKKGNKSSLTNPLSAE